MKPFENTHDDDVRFDRLVDGELSDAERRQLLASLDDEPDGWRRCALAFLEAQQWQQSLAAVQRQANDSGGADRDSRESLHSSGSLHPNGSGRTEGQCLDLELPVSTSEHKTPADGPGFVRLALAMAACFLVAFFLGTEFRQRFAGAPIEPGPNTVQRPIVPEVVGDEVTPVVEEGEAAEGVYPWGEATFVMDDNEGQEMDVPVFDLDPVAQRVLRESSTAVFEDLGQQLQRAGFDVQRKVSWSPVEMGGGQQMFVPVGDFEIRPISHHAIQ